MQDTTGCVLIVPVALRLDQPGDRIIPAAPKG